MTRAGHLVRRFVGSLRVGPLGAADLEFVRSALEPQELRTWERLGRADQAESVATGRATVAALGPDADERYVAAALLHDVGKAETSYGLFRRSGATVAAIVAGGRRARSWGGDLGRYLNHDELGATVLRQVGARREAVVWAAAHHRPELWPGTGIPARICRILAAADGEVMRE